MTLAWIQSVPNFSEGRDPETIRLIVECFKHRKGCHLLDHRADPDHNRLVVSLAGEPEPIQDALIAAAKRAIEKIDLNRHQGSHPRIGAVDVIPFTPLAHITLEQCAAIARKFGERYWQETRVPVYFYEASASLPERRDLVHIRKGQFEALKTEIALPHRRPDVGDPAIHPTAGATVIGARNILVAFNINLASTNLAIAKAVAAALRSASGGLGHVKAIGLALSERNMVQVSCNVIDVDKTPLYRVLEFVRTEARRWGVAVVGSEIYGMAPAAAVLQSAYFYLQTLEMTSEQVIELRLLELMGRENA